MENVKCTYSLSRRVFWPLVHFLTGFYCLNKIEKGIFPLQCSKFSHLTKVCTIQMVGWSNNLSMVRDFEYLPVVVPVFNIKYARVNWAPSITLTITISLILHHQPTLDRHIWKMILNFLKHCLFFLVTVPVEKCIFSLFHNYFTRC